MWRLVRIPKVIALLAFALPWMTVSCSSERVMSATGINLASGDFAVINPLTKAVQTQSGDANLWLVLAIIAIAIGIVASFRRARPGAAIVTATSAVALIAIWLGTRR